MGWCNIDFRGLGLSLCFGMVGFTIWLGGLVGLGCVFEFAGCGFGLNAAVS